MGSPSAKEVISGQTTPQANDEPEVVEIEIVLPDAASISPIEFARVLTEAVVFETRTPA